jgi:acetyl esterase/lipase
MRYVLIVFFMFMFSAGVTAQVDDTVAIPGVTLMKNIRYGTADPKQNFDLYLPNDVKGPLPVMIWIHGGGWRLGGKKNMEIPYLARHGYAIASIAYRFSQDSVFPAPVEDCNAAIYYLYQHARELGVDTSRFVLGGASAGGHLASLIGMSANNHRQDLYPYPLKGRGPSFKGVINFYGPGDLYAFHGDNSGYQVDSAGSSVSKLLGAPCLLRPDLARWASPATYVDKGDPPVLILHGDKDPIIHYYLGVLFYHVLLTSGVRAEMITLPGAGHGGPVFSDAERQEQVLAFLRTVAPSLSNK